MLKGCKLNLLIAILLLSFFLPVSYAQTCGNGTCDPGENGCNCPEDCGICSGAVPHEICKEYACVSGHCKVTTLENCCGNDVCEGGESFSSCPGDCLPEKLDFELLSPDLDENFFRGESVLFRVKISGDRVKILSAEAELSGFFGSLELYNDGRHEDGNVFDGIYANRFLINKKTKAGLRKLSLRAEFREVVSEQDYNFFVDPALDLDIDLKTRYHLGDLIDLSGVVKKKVHRFSLPLNIRINNGREDVFDLSTSSDSNGVFSAQYHSSLIDRSGIWTITIEGVDSNNNTVFLQGDLEMLQPGEEAFLSVQLLRELESGYKRGAAIEVIATVKDIAGEIVEGASVKLVGAANEEMRLLELKLGEYSGIYQIPFDLPLSEQKFTLIANKSSEAGVFSGSNDFVFSVEMAEIILEVLEPSRRRYQIGDNLAPMVFLSYSNEEPVVDATVTALIQNREIVLNSVEAGLFSADYFLQEKDTGRVKLSFKAIDSTGNEGFAEARVEVSGVSLFYTVQKNSLQIVLVLVAIAAGVVVARSFLLKRTSYNSLLKRKKELISLEKDLQHKYFEEAAVPKKDYKSLMDKYETELEGVEKKLAEMKKRGKNA